MEGLCNMRTEDVIECLSLFGIPHGDSCGVRRILARLVAAGSLSLGELQTARDIVERSKSPKEAAYLFLAAMFASQRGGNAFLRPEKGVALLQAGGYLEESAEEGAPSNEEHCADVRNAWAAAEEAANDLDGDVVVRRSDAAGDRWFFQKNLDAVEAVSRGLAARAGRGDADAELSEAELAAAIGFDGFSLNERQVDAVKMAARDRFVVVTGGPGTGKTTVVCAMLRALIARGLDLDEIALAAPTGRAAQRMGEALRSQCARAKGVDPEMRAKIESLDGSTIHSLLGGFPPNWKYTAENKLPLKLVVVDESSMVDVHLMKALVAALPADCRLVLLGDKDQLPSVETGALLGDIVGGRESPFVVRLVESKRFTKDFAESANAVNEGDAGKFAASAQEVSSGDGGWLDAFDAAETENRCFRCLLPERANPSVCCSRLLEWATHYGLLKGGRLAELASDPGWKDDAALTEGSFSDRAKALFAQLGRSRILTVVRQGPYGVRGVNELLVKARFGGRMPFNPLAAAGVPVVVTRNTPSRKLWNGDVGVTVEGKSGMVVVFPRGDKVVCCPAGLMPEHELAYAMTVHKSQGSEFDNVAVVLPEDAGHPLLTRQLVYTGITRAKKRAVVVGTASALRRAVENRLERETGVGV